MATRYSGNVIKPLLHVGWMQPIAGSAHRIDVIFRRYVAITGVGTTFHSHTNPAGCVFQTDSSCFAPRQGSPRYYGRFTSQLQVLKSLRRPRMHSLKPLLESEEAAFVKKIEADERMTHISSAQPM